MELKEPVRCIHTDPKTKKTTVKFLMPHVVERLRKYGWRVEHVAKPQPKAEPVKEIPEAEILEIPEPEFIDAPEPVTEAEATPIEEPKPKRKYATGQPKKVTNK